MGNVVEILPFFADKARGMGAQNPKNYVDIIYA